MTPMTPERLAEIKAKHAAATEGPYAHKGKSGDGKRQFIESTKADTWNCLRAEVDSDDCDYDEAVSTARFLAASWQDVADLIAEVERLRAENAASKSVAQWAQATLTALNGGDVQRESLLHQKLREVMIQYRAALDAAGAER